MISFMNIEIERVKVKNSVIFRVPMTAPGTKQTVRRKCSVSEVSVNANQYKKKLRLNSSKTEELSFRIHATY